MGVGLCTEGVQGMGEKGSLNFSGCCSALAAAALWQGSLGTDPSTHFVPPSNTYILGTGLCLLCLQTHHSLSLPPAHIDYLV